MLQRQVIIPRGFPVCTKPFHGGWMPILFILLLTLQGGCRSTAEQESQEAPSDTPAVLRIDRGVEAMAPDDRLRMLFIAPYGGSQSLQQALTTSAERRAVTEHRFLADHCYDLLVRGPDAPANPWTVRILRTPTTDPNTPAESHQRRSLSYDRSHNEVAILPSFCPGETIDTRIEIHGEAHAAYHLEIYERRAEETESALWRRGRQDLPGFRPTGPRQSDTLAFNRRSSFPLAVTNTRCFAIVAHGENTLEDLDSRLLDLQGRSLALEVATDASSIVGPYCPFEDEIIRVEFRAYAGQGQFYWQLWEAPAAVGQLLLDARNASPSGAISPDVYRKIHTTLWGERTR